MSLDLSLAQAQDVHFSQFWETAVMRNPALTGIGHSDIRAGALYRSQWSSVAAPFQTTAASLEARFPIGHYAHDFVTVSGMFYADKAGRAALKTTAFYPCINYHKSLEDANNSYLSVGFTAGYVQRSFDLSKLTFDNMYQSGAFVASAGAGESLPVQNLGFWDGGAGVSYNSSVGSGQNVNYYIGLSMYHFTKPRASFSAAGEVLTLAPRWSGSLGVNCRLSSTWGLQVYGSYNHQGGYSETVGGTVLRWSRGEDRDGNTEFAISAGALVRVTDAIVPVLKVDYGKQSFGISYDVNTSYLKVASHLRGGLEVTAFFNGTFARRDGRQSEGPRF